MAEIEVGFIAYKNEKGLYDRKIPIKRKVEEKQFELIQEDQIEKWVDVLSNWFKKLMEVQNDENKLGSVQAEAGGRQAKSEIDKASQS